MGSVGRIVGGPVDEVAIADAKPAIADKKVAIADK